MGRAWCWAEAVRDKSNEIPAVRTLVGQLRLAGRTVSLDALHVQADTLRLLVEQGQAHYVTTAVKNNQPTLLEDLKAIDWEGPSASPPSRKPSTRPTGASPAARRLDLGKQWNMPTCPIAVRPSASSASAPV